ncbi:hypothetical protein [Hephaestia mangrovi]|nr:hypothetical protein [Hephaestia mangrovi]MBY8827246.1 hypothetical protein [Hephaestia mangrovi]
MVEIDISAGFLPGSAIERQIPRGNDGDPTDQGARGRVALAFSPNRSYE